MGERHKTFTNFHQYQRTARLLPLLRLPPGPLITLPTPGPPLAGGHACAIETDDARASIADDVVDNSGLSRLLAIHAKFTDTMNPQGKVAKGGKATTQKTYIYYKGYNYRKFRINRKVYIRTKYEGTVYLATIQAWQREEKRKKHTS